jgi:hypothetical protein
VVGTAVAVGTGRAAGVGRGWDFCGRNLSAMLVRMRYINRKSRLPAVNQ